MELALDRVTVRVKARAWPLGAARFRLFLVVRNLGLRREEIEARVRQEREQEIERRFLLQVESETERLAEVARVARSIEDREILEAIEARKSARRLKEALAFERMNEAERETWRMEQEIVRWLAE